MKIGYARVYPGQAFTNNFTAVFSGRRRGFRTQVTPLNKWAGAKRKPLADPGGFN
jgi:hypothetical protein